MKRLLSILALCALALALTACGGGNNASSGGASSAGGEVSFDAVYQGILDAQKDSGQEEPIFWRKGRTPLKASTPASAP